MDALFGKERADKLREKFKMRAVAPWEREAFIVDEMKKALEGQGEVADHIYPLRPVTALVYVIAPLPYPINITLASLEPDTAEVRRYLDRRGRVGLDTSDGAVFLVDLDGKAITEDTLDRHLIFARTVSVAIEGNASFCRGLLAARYGIPVPKEEASL